MAFSGLHDIGFCTVFCSRRAAEDFMVCGDDDGTGAASGACRSGICLEACDVPGGELGSNGCTQSLEMACYPSSLVGEVSVGAGLVPPPGLCIPRCETAEGCEATWGVAPLTCNPVTGLCE